ncbi:oxidoreductase, short chain dehydrogenase/reductase [Streptomyces albus]|uniref:Oxidoreductase, short chain dehydrogenase/reductase n=1 Tax=Streptomyces albus (strain ATCC 21838 / DSM 41398 / FERM P-419 / JCM 4703 / NBRC 107858) TaxID=1081613 RepID=A0A0B5EER4_STRA4|nr:oxidoreductase, short chain dehydrogenase/reductase [Streptomyces albus]AOU74748.1 oxidoreductase, short chain dehydrogenase/reductase [Streptomyces albus]AYN30559.1 NAD(P)-dependent oxidoreductase [Streptomyces albus]
MDLGLEGARVFVTGGAANIGRGIVHGFAAEGARVAVCDLDADQSRKVQAEALARGASAVEVVPADLSRPGAAEQAVAQVTAAWGGVDVLVNNAGVSFPGFVAEDTDRNRWQHMIDVNLFAAVECTQAVLPSMRESGSGAVVYIASDAAFGEIRQAVYGATKAGVVALARTVAKEHGRHGVRSNVVCPGLVIPRGADAVGSTSLWAGGQDAVFTSKQVEYMVKATPLRRLTEAEDVAAAAVWLASPAAARQVTGQVVSVSGGYAMP